MILFLLGMGIGLAINSIMIKIKEHQVKVRIWKKIKRSLIDEFRFSKDEDIDWQVDYNERNEEFHQQFIDIHDDLLVLLRKQNDEYFKLIEWQKALWERVKNITYSLDEEDNILIWRYLENKTKIDMIEKEELYYRLRKGQFR